MPYDRNRSFSSRGQFVGMLGTSLSQILGGYLGAKLEEDKERREYGANKRILAQRYPNMSDNELDEIARVPRGQLDQMIQGVSAGELQRVLSGGMPEGQQMPPPAEGIPEGQQMLPSAEGVPGGQQVSGQDLPIDADVELGAQPEVILPEQALGGSLVSDKQFSENIAKQTEQLVDLESAINTANLTLQDRQAAMGLLDSKKRQIYDSIKNREDVKIKIAEHYRKLENDKRTAARGDIELGLKMSAEERAKQKVLIDEYGEAFKNLVKSEGDLIIDQEVLNSISMANLDPNVEFGSPTFNSLADFLNKKLNIDVSFLQANTAQILNKQFASLFSRIASQLAGTGIRASNLIEKFGKKYANLHQSYVARQFIVEATLAENDVTFARIKEARRLRNENNGLFPKNYYQKLEDRMKPYYKKFINKITKLPKKLENNKVLQAKQKIFEAKKSGAFSGGVLGAIAGAAGGAATGLMVGGLPGAALGTIAGSLGSIGGGYSGAMLGEYANTPSTGLAKTLDYSKQKWQDVPFTGPPL